MPEEISGTDYKVDADSCFDAYFPKFLTFASFDDAKNLCFVLATGGGTLKSTEQIQQWFEVAARGSSRPARSTC